MATLKTKWIKTRWGGLIGALLAIAFGYGLFLSAFGKRLVSESYDMPFLYRAPLASEGVVIVYMDDISHDELKQDPTRPWDRQLHAEMIDILAKEGAKAIIFDIVFSGPSTNLAADNNMAGAMKKFGKVVIGAEYGSAFIDGASSERVLPGYELFKSAAVGCGHTFMYQSSDFTVRLFPEPVDNAGTNFPSLAIAAAELMDHKKVSSSRTTRYINYTGSPFSVPSESYHRARHPEDLSPGRFKDMVVFIGARQSTGFVGTGKDEFRNPCRGHAGGRFSPGTEVHAMAYLNLVHQNWLTRLPYGAEVMLLGLFGLFVGFGLALFRPLATVGLAHLVVLILVVVAFAFHWYAHLWFAWLILPIQTAVGAGWSVVFNSIRLHFEKMLAEAETRTEKAEKERERVEKEKAQEEQKRLEAEKLRLEAEQKLLEQERQVLRDTLVKHLSPGRAEQIIKNPDLLKPGIHRQITSILFSDIEAYSKLSEMLSLEELAVQLNNYYELTLSCVHETDGTVVKLIGDAIFAIWNAPFPQEDHALRACRSALLLTGRLMEYDASRAGPPLKTRIGLHVGEAGVGNIGSSTRFDYTAVGDSVNVASRLEGLNKQIGTRVLATSAFCHAVGAQMVWRYAGLFQFKGIQTLQHVYEVVAAAEHETASQAWRRSFEEALARFSRKDWDEAKKGLLHTLELKPDDGPAQFYLARIAELRHAPLPPEWKGEIILHEK